jgi:hypothetical protein
MPAMTQKLAAHRQYRARVKAKAIALAGGHCQRCGFDADERALQFHHTKPVRRITNGLRRQSMSSTKSHLDVVHREGKGLSLWCANCIAIDTAKDWTLHANVKRRRAFSM